MLPEGRGYDARFNHKRYAGTFVDMKISIDIDCSPEEARRFFGLPDVTPVNETLVETARTRMEEAMAKLDGETLLGQWMGGAGTQVWQNLQNAFVDQMRRAGGGFGGSSGGSGA